MNVYVKTQYGTLKGVVRRAIEHRGYVVRVEVSTGTGIEILTYENYITPRSPTLTIVKDSTD